MKDNFTAIAAIIDGSGSMGLLTNDTIGSFNSFLNEQKAVPGEATLTLCIFNSRYNLVHDFVPIQDVPELNNKTYMPSGGTALLDALGRTIDALGTKLAALPEDQRPSRVLVIVQTDGEENMSHNFTLKQIKEKVAHQTNVYSWSFVFVGAGIDAIDTGTSMGFSAHNSVTYNDTSEGTHQLYKSVSRNLSSYRSNTVVTGASLDFFGLTGETPTTPAQKK